MTAQAISTLSLSDIPHDINDGAILAEGSEAMVRLEQLVDRVGMANVLYALAHIAWAKADHIEANWQDRALAYLWRVGGNRLDKFAARSNVAFHNRARERNS